MKKKIFLIIGSLGAGGSERVFWLLSQYFNKEDFEVSVVYLNANETHFSTQIPGIKFIDLKTVRAYKSFFPLYKLLKIANPFAVFSTTDHINILTAMVCCFLKVPNLIGRASNDPIEMRKFYGHKARFYNMFTKFLAFRFKYIICQTTEMQQSVLKLYGISTSKLRVISNPVLYQSLLKKPTRVSDQKKLIVVARLAPEKGLFRLLEVMQTLPDDYNLTVIGRGNLMSSLQAEVNLKNLANRITFLGETEDVPAHIVLHDLFVLPSFTEGFPNVVLESLAVGVPVVTFMVGGIKELIYNGFNGFIAEQNNLTQLKRLIIEACNKSWNHEEIKKDAYKRFSLNSIGQVYENLLN